MTTAITTPSPAASVGHCLVESIRVVARRDEMKLDAFAISVSAEKSLDAPGRLQTLAARVHGKIVEDQAMAQDLVKQAKSICTVSNTLNSEITVELVLADRA
jgi:organic hydroperoxide reductase OsmC/OhrA